MTSLKRLRPSPALVISCLALFVALGGTAVALKKNSVGSRALKTNAVKGRHVDKQVVKGRHIAPRVIKGRHVVRQRLSGQHIKANSLDERHIDGSRLSVASASTARPFAYAKITANAQVNVNAPSRNIASGNIAKVNQQGQAQRGLYCFNLAFTPTSAVVTPAPGQIPDKTAAVEVAPSRQDCPLGTDVEVELFDASNENTINVPFYIVINN